MKSFHKYWKVIGDWGVAQNPDEETLLRPLNYVIVLSLTTTLILSIIAFGAQIYIYAFVLVACACMYATKLICIYNGKLSWAKMLMATAPSIALFISWIAIGGFFGQAGIAITVIAVTHILFQNTPKLRNALLAFNLIGFTLCSIYCALYPPIVQIENLFLDELFLFYLALTWVFLVFRVYQLEQEKLIGSLQEKNKVLEITSNELERFTHLASHDLKAPLRNINSFLGLIERQVERKEYDTLPESLAFAQSSTQQMQSLLQDMIDLSRLQSGQKDQLKDNPLNEIVSKAQSNLFHEIKSKKAKVITHDLPRYLCNEVEFLLLFQNMIQNGIKYNKSIEPTVEVWANKKDQQLHIYFKDNGIGIAKEHHKKIFDFFQRLHNQKEYEGTGMGLGLCAKIMEKYEGTIQVESEPNKGSLFVITFPLSTNTPTTETKKELQKTFFS